MRRSGASVRMRDFAKRFSVGMSGRQVGIMIYASDFATNNVL